MFVTLDTLICYLSIQQGRISEAFTMFLLFLLLLQTGHQASGSPWCPPGVWCPLTSTLGADYYSSDLSYATPYESSLNRIHPLISRREVGFTHSLSTGTIQYPITHIIHALYQAT